MTIREIETRIRKTGIAGLNDLQRAVRASKAEQLILLAPTGTGKTLAFAIPLLRAVTADAGYVQAVVIAPSRELVLQIRDVLHGLAGADCKILAVYGGNRFEAEAASVRGEVPAIVVGTPGRLADHLKRGTLHIDTALAFVIDEYDKFLSLGFEDEVRRIIRRLDGARVRVLTSATRPDTMPAYIDMSRAETIDFTNEDSGMRLTVVEVPSAVRDKLDTLASLLRDPRTGTSIVFVNHRESADRVVESLSRRGIPATLYHGGLEQREREIAVAKIRAGVAQVLVATDLASRGLDLEAGIDSVIHYHLPVDVSAWTHRNGRTARAGASGSVYVISGPDEALPDYMAVDRPYYPHADPEDVGVTAARKVMLYFKAGKQDKISKGDIAGFLMKVCGLAPDEVGLITVSRDYSLAAVAAAKAGAVLRTAAAEKIKGHRVRVSRV